VPVRKRLKAHLRRVLLKSLARAPFIQMLRIYPPLVHQQCDRNWIYDPEWWDLSVLRVDAAPAVIPNSCGPVVMFIGNISSVKGIDYFIETAALASKSNSTLQFTIVGLGDRLTKRQRESFVSAGGFIVSGVFSDEEFVGFMKRAQFLWCCYDPEYNQSSGIFGRALQLGIPPITRSGSLLANWASQLNFGLQVEFGDATGLIQALLAADVTARIPEEAIFQMRELSVERLHAACFTAPSPSDGT
jgi:glycosyltransferase involved in cell wall biosynthesis